MKKMRHLAVICVLAACTVAGCGENISTAPTAEQLEDQAAVSERDTTGVHLVAVAAYACRDADLGEPVKYPGRLKKRMAELIRIGKLHPDDDYGGGAEDRTPAARLHSAAELLSCDPDLAERVELAARDSEDLQSK